MPKSSNKSKTKISILLADDHHIVRAGVRQLLESARDLQVIAEAGVGEEAQEQYQLSLAYVTSVHKAQGSEFPAVVMPVVTQHYTMLQRNLLYTGSPGHGGCVCCPAASAPLACLCGTTR